MKPYQRSATIIWLEDFVYNIIVRIMRIAVWVLDKTTKK
jgi:hypothetical protein